MADTADYSDAVSADIVWVEAEIFGSQAVARRLGCRDVLNPFGDRAQPFIDDKNGIEINSSLLTVVLHD